MKTVEEGFNPRNIPEDGNIQHVLDYVQKHNLKQIGDGSSRNVFLLSSKKVLKVAKNAAGISQNEEELAVATDRKYNGLVAKVLDASPSNLWLVSELVHELTEEVFESLTGLDWNYIRKVFFQMWRERKPYSEWKNIFKSVLGPNLVRVNRYTANPFLNSIFSKLEGSNIHPGDIMAVTHWGKTVDGNLVILDYGLTDQNYQAYYVKGTRDKGVFENFIRKIVLEEIAKLRKKL